MDHEVATAISELSLEIGGIMADLDHLRKTRLACPGTPTEDAFWSALWQLREAQKSLDLVAGLAG